MPRYYNPLDPHADVGGYVSYMSKEQLARYRPMSNLILLGLALFCAGWVFVKTADRYPGTVVLVGLVLAFVVLSFARGLGGALGVVLRLLLSLLSLWVVIPTVLYAVCLSLPHSLNVAMETANGKGLNSLGDTIAFVGIAAYGLMAVFSIRWIFRRRAY